MANPTLLSMPLCVNADKNTIPSTDAGTSGLFSEEKGFQTINSLPLTAGGKAPARQDFNGIFALLGGIDFMTQRGYTFEFDNTLPYVVGCIVRDTDGKLYRCINDVAAGGTAPSLDTMNWMTWDLSSYLPTSGGEFDGTDVAYDLQDNTGTLRFRIKDSVSINAYGTNTGVGGGYYITAQDSGGTNSQNFQLTHSRLEIEKVVNGGSAIMLDLLGASIVSKSITSSGGYIKCQSGLIYAWGKFTAQNVATQVVFPITFTSAPCVYGAVTQGHAFVIYSVSTTDVYLSNESTSSNNAGFWFAIGY